MKKWTMLLALLLATVFCFPGALAEQEAVESTGIMVAGSWSPMFTSRRYCVRAAGSGVWAGTRYNDCGGGTRRGYPP